MKDFKLEEALSAPFLKHNEIVYFPVVFENDGESFSIINNGTAASPCRITIVPQNDIMLLQITGLSQEPIKVTRVQRGNILIIDGIDKAVTIDGEPAFDRYDAWEFPKLSTGTNNIKITSGGSCQISIQYQPRYV